MYNVCSNTVKNLTLRRNIHKMNNNRIYTSSSNPVSSNLIYHICALIAVIAWGIAFINTKALMTAGLSAVEVYVYRFLIAYLCVFLICPKPFFSNSVSDEVKFFLCGLCGNSIYFIAENTALDYTLVTNVSLIVTLAPIITAFLVGMIYKSQRPSTGFISGSAIAFVGVGCVIFNSSFLIEVKPLGDLLALLAAVCWAIYSILLRPLNTIYNVWFITRKTFFYGLITSIPFLLVEPSLVPFSTLLEPKVLLNLGFLAIVCSLLAYLFWAQAIKRLGVTSAGNYLYICPIVTFIASALILHETVTVIGVIGCVLILLGVILSEKLKF